MSGILEPIAIIGMAGRFPGARDLEELWDMLRDGREAVSFPSDAELLAAGVPAAWLRDPAYVKAVAQAPDIDLFDASFFGMTPKEAQVCDPQIRCFLETAHAALENAGYAPEQVSDVGVFGSTGANRYLELLGGGAAARSAAGMSVQSLNHSDYLATLVSYRFGFSGPSLTVQTACSSALVAVALAVNALRLGECHLALAGGADVELPLGHGHWWSQDGPLSRDGHCRPFDIEATGTIFGSGAGVVVLKRLSDALADQDCVRAVLHSIAVNNDGSDKVGFTAPSVLGQSTAIAEAMTMADVDPREIGYVEAHGTGTALGDAVEIAALNRAFESLAGPALTPGSCPIGSVKANVGHLGHASGIVALVKVVLALERERIPASINFREANPKLPLQGSPFFVNQAVRAWPRSPGQRRLAGVSSLGIGGTNVHAVVEEGPPRVAVEHGERPRVAVWSAKSTGARQALRKRLADHFERSGEPLFADTVATLQHGRTAHPVRSAVIASSAAEASAALRGDAAVLSDIADHGRTIAFLFPGQGAQHLGMAAGLYRSEPAFAAALDHVFGLLAAEGLDVETTWRIADDEAALADTAVAQPLLFAVEHALAEMWSGWGIEPAAVLGHSVGELVAAARAGLFALPDAVRLVAARARAMRAAPPGGMLAVAAPAPTVEPLLPADCCVAVVNSSAQTVVAGPLDRLQALVALLAERRVAARRLRASHAFHSPLMAGAVAEFARAFDGLVLRPPQVPLYSAATGRRTSEQEATDPAFWSGQVATPVWFGRALDALLSDGKWELLEVGPGHTITALAARHPAVRNGPHRALATLPARPTDPSEDLRSALHALAALWTAGGTVDWAVAQPFSVRRVPVPGYPYQRTRAWVEPDQTGPAPATTPTPATTSSAGAPPADSGRTTDRAAVSPFSVPTWVQTAWRTRPAQLPRALLLPPTDPERGRELTAALQRVGLQVTPVHPDGADDPDQLFRRLAEERVQPELVIHAGTLGEWEWPDLANVTGQLDRAVHSTIALYTAAMRDSGGGPLPSLLVLTSGSADVSGSEPVHPVKAALHGLVRTLALEEPRSAAKLVDLVRGVAEEVLAAELGHWRRSELVALRGDRRWAWTERPLVLAAGGQPVLRSHGVYLITGGLGGLGLAVAKGIASTGLRPRLVLLGRRGLPEPAQRERMIRAGDERMARIVDELDQLDALGAQTRVITCDVTDLRAVHRAVDIATARFGPVNGLMHLAGVPGDGMLQFRTREQVMATLAAKVVGTLCLQAVFADRPRLDFFVGFSSQAAIGGLVGGGDYAAANGFLDAFARGATIADRMLSVNWPAWSDVGMAAQSGMPVRDAVQSGSPVRDAAVTPRWRTMLRAEDWPILDEHRLGSVPVLPGTAQLDLVIQAFASTVRRGGGTGWRLEDVVFRRAVAVPSDRTLEIRFEPAGGERWRFALWTTPLDGDDRDAQLHTTGLVAAAEPTSRQVDLDRVREGLRHRFRPSPQPRQRRLFTLGPHWSNIVEVATRPEQRGEQLLELRLPEMFAGEVSEHTLHPALLDSATSSARDAEREEPHVPFGYQSVRVHAPLPSRLFSHVRRHPSAAGTVVADIDLIAPDGATLVEITGFTMRQATAGLLSGADSQEAAGPAAPAKTGIAPDQGVRLLLQLLAAKTPRQVAVRPFRDGAPTALTKAPGPLAETDPPVGQASAPSERDGVGDARPVRADGNVRRDNAAPDGGPPESLESQLAALWSAHFGIKDVQPDMDFFDLGGDSLAAVVLMSEIRERFAVDLGIAALFDYPTLGALTEHVRKLGGR